MVEAGLTLMPGPVAPVLHEYEVAPVAVSVAEAPEQTVAELAVTVGLGTTLAVAVDAELQPLVVPVTV